MKITQIPQKQINSPNTANFETFSPRKKQMITIQIGNMAAIIAPSPLLIYLTPQVLKPLLRQKFRKARTKIVLHCFPFGQGSLLIIKYKTYIIPPINCLIVTSCKAGMSLTPSFDASQVVPQKKLTQHKAKIGNPMVSILFEKAFWIFAFTLNYFSGKYSKNNLNSGSKYMNMLFFGKVKKSDF